MVSKIEIINSPYQRRVKILINGNAPSAFSALDKYMTESFIYWCGGIFSAIHDELNGGSYAMHFVSRAEEIEVMQKLAGADKFCVQFSSGEIVRNTSLTSRMAQFSKWIKDNRIQGYRYVSRKAVFVLPDSEKSLIAEIPEIQVRNQFCKIESVAVPLSEYQRSSVRGDVTIQVCRQEDTDAFLTRTGIKDGYLIMLGANTRFEGLKDRMLCYISAEDAFFDTVFKCFILGPLADIFYESISSLTPDIRGKYGSELELLQSSSVGVVVKAESNVIEKGTSIRLKLESDMPGYGLDEKELEYGYSEKGIIRCNGLRVEGLKDGECTLYIYRIGEKDPMASDRFRVITRNRVTELILEDQSLIIGEGDSYRLSYQYRPEGADNTDKIDFISDNESAATVSGNGTVRGVHEGEAMIIMTCERVSTRTRVQVLPHIRGLKVTENDIYMTPGMTVDIHASTVPQICIESGIKLSVMDVKVANAVNGKVNALALGDTTLIVQDKREACRKDISVHVVTEKQYRKLAKRNTGVSDEKKKGLFSKLFG